MGFKQAQLRIAYCRGNSTQAQLKIASLSWDLNTGNFLGVN